ncbi:hypothetical protein K1719_018301 [Acacia pycnantha]|nr:hypothetical protein K1719_018301 [Acacia pycnantha]
MENEASINHEAKIASTITIKGILSLLMKLSFIRFNLRISMAMLPPLVFSKREGTLKLEHLSVPSMSSITSLLHVAGEKPWKPPIESVKKSEMPTGPRAGFSMCVHKRRVVLFGGVVDMEVEGGQGDTSILAVSAARWSAREASIVVVGMVVIGIAILYATLYVWLGVDTPGGMKVADWDTNDSEALWVRGDDIDNIYKGNRKNG